MIKTYLKVTKFENKDVITTSVCAHLNFDHIEFTYIDETNYDFYYWKGTDNQDISDTELLYSGTDHNQTIEGVTSPGWYYKDANGKYHKCSDTVEHHTTYPPS